MTRDEFTQSLRRALTGRLDHAGVDANVTYYQDYIDSEIKKGRSEAEVLEFLGDPRLIAKTILNGSSIEDASAFPGPNPFDDQAFRGEAAKDDKKKNFKYINIPPYVFFIVVVLIVLLAGYVLTYLAPLIILICFIAWMIKRFKGK